LAQLFALAESTMPTYTLLSGEAIEYPKPASAVADLLARALAVVADLRELACLNIGSVTKLEQGQREPAWPTVLKLAAALGVGCRAFTSGEPAGGPPAKGPRGGAKGTGKKGSGRAARFEFMG
jgi:hypothetical protein